MDIFYYTFPLTRQKCESFLPKHELLKNSNRKSITLFNVTDVKIEPSVEIEPAVLIEPY